MARGRGYVATAQSRLATAKARARGRGSATGGGRGRGGSSPMPFDSQAQRESGELGNEAADTRANLAAQFAAAQSSLGFGSGASNPYSATAENKTALTNNQRGIGTAAGNNLYSGSTLNAQSQARSAYDKTQQGIESEIAGAQGAFTGGLAKTGRDEQLGQSAIREGAIGRAAASEPEPLGVGRGRGRGRLSGPGADGRNVRRPQAARRANAQARAINSRLNGRGRI